MKKLEINLFTDTVIDCKGQNNIGSILQYLEEVVGLEISSYSSRKEIISNEVIYISKYGALHEYVISQTKTDKISGSDFLRKYVFKNIELNIEIDKLISELKQPAYESYEKMNYCFDNNTETLDGVHREYYKGVSNFYNTVCTLAGTVSELKSEIKSEIKNNSRRSIEI